MRFAQVVVDIPTRELDQAYTYAIPFELASSIKVGVTVLVSFSHRQVVGYVIGLADEPPISVAENKILPIRQVLSESAFDEVSSRIAQWMAIEYACPLAVALRPFLAPGQKPRVSRKDDGEWELICAKTGPCDTRWVMLTEFGATFEPMRRAMKQRGLMAALREGPVRMTELKATLAGVGPAVRALEKKGVVEVVGRRRMRDVDTTTLSSARADRPEHLTAGQHEALAAIDAARAAGRGDVVLVDGVTGSGKTEVYLAAIEGVRAAGAGAVVLVPEISLTAQTVGRFHSRFGDDVAVLHSRLSAGQRYDQWDLVRRGVAHVVVGARSALFAPLYKVGLIVIDEEHDESYKQDHAPRYHARDLAARMAQERGAALVVGSATPSLESLRRCQQGSWAGAFWTRVAMPERPGQAVLPVVDIVDMTQQFACGRRFVFSEPLANALTEIVRRREKAVLLLNRRGFASFLMCRACGCVPECPHCSTALTYHERTRELMCHSCGRSWSVRAWPDPLAVCPNCGSRYMGAYGIGTQRVEDELHIMLDSMGAAGDSCDVIRMDADTTRTKGSHQALLERFDSDECAILVGTQMIAKGLDFPDVTLVGVVNGDTTLKLPDFRAAERTYALLEQVAGRAGRGDKSGRVIVQSYWAAHPAIACVATHDRKTFVRSELTARREAYYPPFSRLSNVVVWGPHRDTVQKTTDRIAQTLRDALAREDDEVLRKPKDLYSQTPLPAPVFQLAYTPELLPGWEVLGPAACVKGRIKDRYRRHVLVKSPLDSTPGPLISSCVRAADPPADLSIAIDIDAHDLL